MVNNLDGPRLLPKARLDDLIGLLHADGYEVVGPRRDRQAIVYGPLRRASDLPIGWTDRQEAGNYRLERRGDDAYFGFAVGPHSWKQYLFPPMLRLWRAERTADGFTVTADEPDPPRRALLGVRSCELHAIAIQDRVFRDRDGRFTDPAYAAARSRLLLVAVECQAPAATCFCRSMGTGPAVEPERIPGPLPAPPTATEPAGRVALPLASRPASTADLPACDLVLTELDAAFVARATSAAGGDVLGRLGLGAAAAEEVTAARQRVEAAARAMGRAVDTNDLPGLLQGRPQHPRWEQVADRCLACTNCTLVCPTCFCSCTTDHSDLSGEQAERHRLWDSCFNPEFARVHGGNFRPSIRGRYRQWLTHKFASWVDQFGVSGCVGCGRCITWCPVGIDVTEEIAAIRAPVASPAEGAP